ncbi:sensor histidine kinase [Polymorphospora sp. NPDC051019]|uniref:sensor histidine kinase n=1 Tax=Polymorphospora sp. NPDC051019 TaxID=3155725 RepID=UPI003438B77B
MGADLRTKAPAAPERPAGETGAAGAATDRWLAYVVFGLAALCGVLTVASFWCDLVEPDLPRPGPLDFTAWSSTLPGLAFALSGALIAARVPRHRMTWILTGGGLIACLDGFAATYAALSVLAHDGGLPLTGPAVYVGARFGPMINLVVPLVLLFFPDGRLPSPRWRLPAALSLAGTGTAVLLMLTVPWDLVSGGEPVPPGLAGVSLDPVTPPLPAGFWASAQYLIPASLLVSLVVPVAAFARRFGQSDPERRAQLRWMLLAGSLSLPLLPVAFVLGGQFIGSAMFALSMVAVSAAVAVAVTRYRLYDVDALLGWTLLYGPLAAVIVAVDIAVFVGVGTLVDDPVAAVVAAGFVAVLYGPLRARMQRLVTRLLRGRGEPYDVVSVLARRLEESSGPDEQLLAVARTVSTAFRSPYVRVELDRADGRTVVAGYGTPRDDVVVLPFAYRGVPIGRLTLLARPGNRLSDADQRLLADVVRQAGAAARATALTEELQRSREALVTGVAEERRRLRRDLHDGLGPALAAAALKIEAARNVARRDVAGADGILTQVAGDLTAVLGDVRRLVHDLRPPALDQFGLVGAVEQVAARFRGGPLDVTVTTSGDLSALPAAVEVAAYRIVGEALANVSRHAAATHCTVELAAGDRTLRVEIADDGRGAAPDALVGVGLLGMRERAEELGGACTVTRRPSGGTLVSAMIPYGRSVTDGAAAEA